MIEVSKMIRSISVKNFRGLKETGSLEIAGNRNITFLVGPNNAGKSLLARLFGIFQNPLHDHDGYILKLNNFRDSDYFDMNTDNLIEIRFDLDKDQLFRYLDGHKYLENFTQHNIQFCLKIRKMYDDYVAYMFLSDGEKDSHRLDPGNKVREFFYSTQYSGKFGIEEDNIVRLSHQLYHLLQKSILVFDSIRSFDRAGGTSSFSVTGANLLEWLQESKSQGDIRRAKDKVSGWLARLGLDVPRAVRVDEQNKNQLVFTFENHMELSSLEVGTGYTMLYILLLEIARGNKKLILIDEIESHLQPGLIRDLISIIRDVGDIQYMLATHSPTVIDAATDGDVFFQFKKENEECKVIRFERKWSNGDDNTKRLREVSHALGIIPGDALLSNTVIWVEGPSEILWVRAWLKTYYQFIREKNNLRENLIEGLHYSILMTGGNLIAHYAFTEDEVNLEKVQEEQLLNVLKINPNPFVMIDWDNPEEGSEKWKRIIRISKEINKQNESHPVFKDKVIDESNIQSEYEKIPNLWILKGKELENYAHPQLLKDFYTEKSGKPNTKVTNIDGMTQQEDWDVFSDEFGAGKILDLDKTKGISSDSGSLKHKKDLAHFVFNHLKSDHFEKTPNGMLAPNGEMIDDLVKNLEKMIRFIRRSNGMDKS